MGTSTWLIRHDVVDESKGMVQIEMEKAAMGQCFACTIAV